VTGSGLIIDDRYRLDEQIAAGGVGQVWRATDLLLERPVAVKVLRPEYADHSDTLERFRKEARHAGALSHPRVAQVYDFGHAGPNASPYLVMEFVDGPSLADLLADSPADPVFALDVVAQVADGLSAAHRAGLVHRDVKPGNILIGPEGRVKVTDFGIAHAIGQTPVTDPALVMGTSQYLAPERIAGGPGTPASDLYSLGIVLHECLTGTPPYDGTPAEVMASHLYLPLPPLPASVPHELDALIAQLTAKDPGRRLRDARDLAALASRLRDSIAAGPALVPVPVPTGAAPAGPGGWNRAEPVVWDLDTPVAAVGQAAATMTSAAGPLAGQQTAPPFPPGPTGGLPVDDAGVDAATRRRQRRAAAILGAGAILLATGGLTGLLVSGAIGAPAKNQPPARPSAGSPTQRTRPAAPGSTSTTAPGGGVTAPTATTSGTPSGRAKHGKGGKTATPSPSAHPTVSTSGSPAPSPTSPGTPTTSPSSSPPSGTPSGSPSSSPSAVPSPSPSKSTCILGICL
jgi:serine/threonine-protein kinase